MSDIASAGRRGSRLAVTWGEAATTSLLVAILSGVALAIPYDPSDALTSVATLVLANPAAAFFRNLHYWSAQGFLLLSLLHIWDHIRRPDGRVLRLGVWIRLCLSVPAIGLVAWSGFVLKGDVEAWQAWRVVATTLRDVPLIGSLLAPALFGRNEQLFLVYVHHVATLTLFVWIVAVEHGRVLWPRAAAVATVLVPATVLSLFIAPQLHDGISAVVKGPWYFVGLQEAFHWSPWPQLVVGLATLPVLVLFSMRWMSPRARTSTSYGLLSASVFYATLTGIAWAGRGANWAWTDAWRTAPASLVVAPILTSPDPAREPLRGRALPVVMGRPEGCLVCHRDVVGLSTSHDPQKIGCASCHLGNVFSLDAATAHRGMRLVPGNLADADRTCGGDCHTAVVSRVKLSLMTSNAGIVAVNRAAWGHADSNPGVGITAVDHAPADSHLRQLCSSCHLAVEKTEPWPITEESRGGGCTACHVSYSPEAQVELDTYRTQRPGSRQPPRQHPDLPLPVSNAPCFGCHSRSGRISLSYDGWHEANPVPAAGPGVVLRRLDDGRDVVQVTPDAHASKGLLCVDCHTAQEVMGDGRIHSRQHEQAHVACEDCHPVSQFTSAPGRLANEESRRLIALRKALPVDRALVTTSTGDVLVNSFVDGAGKGHLVAKVDGRTLALRAPRPECVAPAHANVSCIGCHTAWAPRCPSCHTSFSPQGEGYDNLADRSVVGEWVEEGGGFSAVPPTLGVRTSLDSDPPHETFDPFIPGMVATLDASAAPGGARTPTFRRWYSRTFSHTVTRAGRSCESCHNDPVALGYGEGRLTFVPTASRRGRWQFTPTYPAERDGLPRDAWVGFLEARAPDVSSRPDVRPLNPDEQRRILGVGACLTCHRGDSPVMRDTLTDFARVVAAMTPQCRRATW